MAASVHLAISGADIEQETVAVGEGITVLGRGPTSTIVLNHPQVSRRHAEIRNNGAGPEIADQGSANGTRVNNVELPVKEWQPLHAGDRVEIGPFSLNVRGGVGTDTSPMTRLAGSEHTVLISPPVTGLTLKVAASRAGNRDYELTRDSYSIGRNAD